ncbi:Proline synthase co-transcribed bacterial-like protein isoform X2 [Oopsacas minuta]|uniref:Pyridoxal phosphate homeostasis protein n=1 Tax=Oopsacas minuta TaxID=111878 RepID=A0AAV7JJN1_9METZ|nr:Proline synthase co-transcribed bacterial-like protein isoform X2 [Oopsacas minuta]
MSVRMNLNNVLSKIEFTFLSYKKLNAKTTKKFPRLVAVSKTKSVELILEAYVAGQRHFGENYVQELYQKSTHQIVLENCKDIHWHFIGHLQRKNAKLLTRVPNLWICESLDSIKLAETLNYQCEKSELPPLRVMVQVNTSREENKFGCRPDSCQELVDYVMKHCPRLKFTGLMTIGRIGHDFETMGVNPDYMELINCKEIVCKDLSLSFEDVELSMGMSSDYIHAVELGSDNVRVGTLIFGARDYVKKNS